MTEHLIIGIPKSGTTSLYKKLQNDFPESRVKKLESIYDPQARMIYNTWHKGALCHVIVREQADRLWSGFHFFGYYKRMPFEVFLENEDIQRQNLGFNQPLEMCNWTPFLQPFMDLLPKIHFLHELKQNPDFPREKDQAKHKPEYQSMPKEYLFMVEESLKDRGLDKYGIPKNWDYLEKNQSLEFESEFDNKYL